MRVVTGVVLGVFFFCLTQEAIGQRFKATGILGINMAQIDGDSLFGFNHAGITAGARLAYANDKIWDISLEMLFSQRGASDRFPNRGKKIRTQYLEIPVVLSLRDWFIEDQKYYKVRADLGLTYGVLFNPATEIFDVSRFNNQDISWLVGAGVQLTQSWGISLRYTSSLVNLYKSSDSPIDLQSYFITLRTELNF